MCIKLESCVQKPLTTIVAGAGYGKTQTVISFLKESNEDYVWLPLTVLDNKTSKHWENAKNILSAHNPLFAENLDAMGFPDTPDKMNAFIFLLSETVPADRRCILVYDDFHLITEERMLRYIERLVNVCIPNLSIMLISRKEPEINTTSLLSKGLLATMDEADFRFSESEMAAYFELNHIMPSSLALSKIHKQTDGWILAIYLIGLSLKKGTLHEEYALTAMRTNVFKLMESEIYAVASEDFQRFLVKLSLFDNLPLELLEVLCEGNRSFINRLSSVTSFVRYDSLVNTYYIHHLFLEFLSEKQSLLTGEEKTECYLKAAEWFEENNYRIDAIENYGKAKQYIKMQLAIANHPSNVSVDLARYFLQVYDKHSKDTEKSKYMFMVLRPRFSAYFQSYEETMLECKKAEKVVQTFPPSPDKNYLLCCLYLIWAFIDLYNYKSSFIEVFKKAHAVETKFIVKYKLTLRGYACIVGAPEQGAFKKFLQDVEDILPCMILLTNGAGYGYNNLCKAEFAFFQKDLKQAEKCAHQAIVNAQKADQYYVEDIALFYLMRISISLGNYDDILEYIEKLKLQIEKYQHTSYYTMHMVASGWFYSLIGQMAQVALWNDESRMNLAKTASSETAVWCQFLIARCFFATKRYSEALAVLDSLENTKEGGQLLAQIEIAVLKAAMLHQLEERDNAIEMLQKAYELSHINAFIMPFIELGNNMLTLVKTAMKSKKCGIPRDWLEDIQKKCSAYAKRIAYLSSEHTKQSVSENDIHKRLTKKELECIRDLCQGLSRTEIAACRNVSENIIKFQIISIYNKLGVKNSKELIRVAYSLKLI